MIATLFLAATLGGAQQQSLYQQIIKKPTFNNGYEEYVQAADIAVSARLSDLNATLTATNDSRTRLDRQRVIAAACGRVLNLIKQGNAKQVSYPGKLDMDVLLPELTHFRAIGAALVTKAHVDFADGRVNEGFETLMATITFGEQISFVGPLIHDLSGRVIVLPAFKAVSENLALASVPSAREMERTAAQLLKAGNAWATSVQFEIEVFISARLLSVEGISSIGLDELIDAEFAATSDERRRAIWKELEFSLRRHYQGQLDAVKLPEREWIPAANRVMGASKPTDPIAARIFESLLPNSSRAILHEIVRRTHLRMLRVVAALVEFKWDHGYFPGALDQLPDPLIAQDPLTGGPFVYERQIGSFALYSEGTDDTGRIGLDYVAARN